MVKSRRNKLIILGASDVGTTSMYRKILGNQADVIVIDGLVEQDYSALEDRILAHCGSPLGNVDIKPSIQQTCYEERDYRFNQKPEKSTFTPKINRATKRW